MVVGCGDASKSAVGPWIVESREGDSGPMGMGPSVDTGDTGRLNCGEASGVLPAGLQTIQWDDGSGYSELDAQDWAVEGREFRAEEAYEAVRFDLHRPARIHGFSIEYGVLPDGDSAPIVAGVYPDFGHNGFDFWRFDPLWEGSLCRGDMEVDALSTFVLDEPVEILQPTPVYIAHSRSGEGSAGWRFDLTSSGDCGVYDNCHSALNFPGIGSVSGTSFWNGYSFSLQYDYVVRLHLEYTDEIADSDRLFQVVPEVTLGSRQAWGDIDNDGDPDLFSSGPILHRNDSGVLVDITEESGLAAMGLTSSGGTWGDFNNDACLDLFSFAESGTAPDALLRGDCEGGFEDVTLAAGIVDEQAYNDCAGAGWTTSPTTAASWVDIDGDGWLDLYLSNFNCWTDYSHYVDTVWRNNGDGTFSDWSGTIGFYGMDHYKTASRGANPIDRDQDGDVDIWVNNYVLERNLLFTNLDGVEVAEDARMVGLAGHPFEVGVSYYYGHTIGTAWGDLDGDGDFDAVAANLAHPRFYNFSDKTQILLQGEDGQFEDIQGDWSTPYGGAGLRFQETHSVPQLSDFDNDGDLDLVITATYDGRPTDFYYGNGDGTFELDVFTTGLDFTNGWGVAAADFDGDGDVDLATSKGLYRNTLEAEEGWLKVRVASSSSRNSPAMGATVRLRTSSGVLIRHVSGGNGQGGQDDSTLHFGLGTVSEVDSIEVDFPGGGTVSYTGSFSINQTLILHEEGEVEEGFGSER